MIRLDIESCMKKFLLIISFIFPNLAWGQVVINEIMYDLPGADAGREWVEIFNSGSESVDLTGWKLTEAGVNHSLNIVQGPAVLPAGGYAVIADDAGKFSVDWPNLSDTLFNSSFSLSNTGESLILLDAAGATVDSVTYDSAVGAAGSGDSLQKVSGSWLAALPTPGAANNNQPSPPVDDQSSDGDGDDNQSSNNSGGSNNFSNQLSSHASPADLSDLENSSSLQVGIGRDRLVTVFSPVEFQAAIKPSSAKAKFIWSFGDGTSGQGREISHTYQAPGIYQVVLNVTADDEVAVARAKVKVILPEVVLDIKPAGSGGLSAPAARTVEVVNRSTEEINLGAWQLRAADQSFTFPRDTIVAPKTSLLLPAAITGLNLTAAPKALELRYPHGELAASSLELLADRLQELKELLAGLAARHQKQL